MGLVVKLESIVGVGEILFCLHVNLNIRLGSVEELGSIAEVVVVGLLLGLESFVVALFFVQRGLTVVPAERRCEIIAANEGRGVQQSPTMTAMLAIFYRKYAASF